VLVVSEVDPVDAESAAAEAFFFATFLATAFFATGLLEAGILAPAFFAAVLLASATVFAAAAFFGARGLAFFAGGAVTAFCVFAFLATPTTSAAGAAALLSTRKVSRLFAPAIQLGARPKPVQVFPVFGSMYFATPTPARLLEACLGATFLEMVFLAIVDEAFMPRCSTVTPSEAISAFTLLTDASISAFAVRANSASSAAIFFRRSVSLDMGLGI